MLNEYINKPASMAERYLSDKHCHMPMPYNTIMQTIIVLTPQPVTSQKLLIYMIHGKVTISLFLCHQVKAKIL